MKSVDKVILQIFCCSLRSRLYIFAKSFQNYKSFFQQETKNDDDNSMRLKLFRLMYETIKDSDMKCKRAELIRSHYENSSAFEIGYLMGDVMDKYNIMSDISMTLNRLFHEWKPIEHINAYEQISNQAIEINHLIDMMKGISRKNETRIRK